MKKLLVLLFLIITGNLFGQMDIKLNSAFFSDLQLGAPLDSFKHMDMILKEFNKNEFVLSCDNEVLTFGNNEKIIHVDTILFKNSKIGKLDIENINLNFFDDKLTIISIRLCHPYPEIKEELNKIYGQATDNGNGSRFSLWEEENGTIFLINQDYKINGILNTETHIFISKPLKI